MFWVEGLKNKNMQTANGKPVQTQWNRLSQILLAGNVAALPAFSSVRVKFGIA